MMRDGTSEIEGLKEKGAEDEGKQERQDPSADKRRKRDVDLSTSTSEHDSQLHGQPRAIGIQKA